MFAIAARTAVCALVEGPCHLADLVLGVHARARGQVAERQGVQGVPDLPDRPGDLRGDPPPEQRERDAGQQHHRPGQRLGAVGVGPLPGHLRVDPPVGPARSGCRGRC
jgi:hypothetical protein